MVELPPLQSANLKLEGGIIADDTTWVSTPPAVIDLEGLFAGLPAKRPMRLTEVLRQMPSA
ncbi:hypothetical protein [Pseudomonas putida]|uniref:hypothetical protein n=1 Tax=Pseudomonas putida TaxID=303 RepID=UPI00085953D8|nr:hypothetical protein [Pseudomonas putida]